MSKSKCRRWIDDGFGGGCAKAAEGGGVAILRCGGDPLTHCYEPPVMAETEFKRWMEGETVTCLSSAERVEVALRAAFLAGWAAKQKEPPCPSSPE